MGLVFGLGGGLDLRLGGLRGGELSGGAIVGSR